MLDACPSELKRKCEGAWEKGPIVRNMDGMLIPVIRNAKNVLHYVEFLFLCPLTYAWLGPPIGDLGGLFN
jgi:hypothetical protein